MYTLALLILYLGECSVLLPVKDLDSFFSGATYLIEWMCHNLYNYSPLVEV